MHRVLLLLFSPRLRPLWWVVLGVLLAGFTLLAFAREPLQMAIPQGDKVNHVAAYALLAGLAALALAPRWRNGVAIACVLLTHGGLIEIVQTQLPYRHGDWADLVADAVGIALGLGAVVLMRRSQPALPAPH